jgi:hypothetical protein
VLSLPFELRYRLAWDHELCRAVLAVYTRALLGFYRKRAKGPGHPEGRTGTVTVIQRFGGALNLNVHFHTLPIDGVFVRQPDHSLSFAGSAVSQLEHRPSCGLIDFDTPGPLPSITARAWAQTLCRFPIAFSSA